MADEHVHKQEFLIRNLPTRLVTLYPTKAQIIRDINDVTLRPGANEITIYGITPTADDSSIKVDGRGSATITDMMVDLVPNKQAYEDVYPDSEDDDEYSSDHPGDSESDMGNEEIKTMTSKILKFDEELKHVVEDHNSASGQLSILEKYKNSVEERAPGDLTKFIQVYREERQKVFAFFNESESRLKLKNGQRVGLEVRKRKALEALRKERAKLNRAKKTEAEKKARAYREKKEAKCRLREERSLFWAKKVYRVVISLEASMDTPASSRRGSIETLSTLRQEPVQADAFQISLSISYVSSAASWVPRYDLSLNTSTAAGTIIYRSEYYNATSETWKDTKVSLSTSEAAFQGLGQPAPVMVPWHVQLANGAPGGKATDALLSNQEQDHKIDLRAVVQAKANEPRAALFGLTNSNNSFELSSITQQERQMPQLAQQQMIQQTQKQMMQQAPQQMMQQAAQISARQQLMPGRMGTRGSFGGFRQRRMAESSDGTDDTNLGGEASSAFEREDDSNTPSGLPSLATEEATWAEEGLTFTYDIGIRTITPSFTKRRYRISSLQLKKVNLSYLLVPKLQAAAFLKARIQNSSSIALLRGMAGVTLDGSFLGNTTLPRCSAGESLSLSLGVDPAVNVTYGKPTMKRNKESGLFFTQKEESHVFTRTCTIMNTKPNRAIEGVMLDQVPLSQDERLKVWILEPSDINGEEMSRSTGEGITKVACKEAKWGVATATHKARGEIRWDFKIEPSRGGSFILEYQTRYPGGDSMIGA